MFQCIQCQFKIRTLWDFNCRTQSWNQRNLMWTGQNDHFKDQYRYLAKISCLSNISNSSYNKSMGFVPVTLFKKVIGHQFAPYLWKVPLHLWYVGWGRLKGKRLTVNKKSGFIPRITLLWIMTASIYDKADRWRRQQTSWFYFQLLKAPSP